MMASVTFQTHVSAQTGGIGSIWQRLTGRIAAWQDRAQARAEMAQLTDHQLKDVGLTRGDVYREMHKGPWAV